MFKLVQDDIADDVVQWVTARPELGGRPWTRRGRCSRSWIRWRCATRSSIGCGLVSPARPTRASIARASSSTSSFGSETKRPRPGWPPDRPQHAAAGADQPHRLPVLAGRADGATALQARTLHGRHALQHQPPNHRLDGRPSRLERNSSLLLRRSFLNHVSLQLGVEHLIFRDFIHDETADAGLRVGDTTGDFDETSSPCSFPSTSRIWAIPCKP